MRIPIKLSVCLSVIMVFFLFAGSIEPNHNAEEDKAAYGPDHSAEELKDVIELSSRIEQFLQQDGIRYGGVYVEREEIIVQLIEAADSDKLSGFTDDSQVKFEYVEHTYNELNEEMEKIAAVQEELDIRGYGIMVKENKVMVLLSHLDNADKLYAKGVDKSKLIVGQLSAIQDQA